ncbi:MAG: hypothetical protein GQ535_00700 [Rhodobacteraceae bacterium]|nr:hypothetical protein [Paracoccaceae bacterium]
MPDFGEGMISGLNWILRSYQTNPDESISNGKHNYFGWGEFWLEDIPVESIWEFGDWRMCIQDGRWNNTDKLEMSIKNVALALELA